MFVEHKEALEVPATSVKLKLSQAIRIGAAIRPQTQQQYFLDEKSCALGAAYEGATGIYRKMVPGDRFIIWKFITNYFDLDIRYLNSITEKNDDGITRESIADWLEGEGL